MSNETRYTLSFSVRDGDNEYHSDTFAWFDHEPSEREQVEAVVRNYSGSATDAETEKIVSEAIAQYEAEGYFEEMPGYRHFSEIGIEKDYANVNANLLNACRAILEFRNADTHDSMHRNSLWAKAMKLVEEAVAESTP